MTSWKRPVELLLSLVILEIPLGLQAAEPMVVRHPLSLQTNESREKTSIPNRYCMYKELLGVCVGMGTKAVVRDLDKLTTWTQLKDVTLGQVFDWPDFARAFEIRIRAGNKGP